MWSYWFVPSLLSSFPTRIQFPLFPSQSETETLLKRLPAIPSGERAPFIVTEGAIKIKNTCARSSPFDFFPLF